MTKPKDEFEPYRGPAGGWGALKASTRHLYREGALTRGIRTLLRVNQTDGFDCPGCAWPEGGERSRFEFCENGVKAVAFEATSHRVGPEFFARHTVAELLEQSDHWLESQGRLTHPMRWDESTDRYLAVTWEAAFKEIGASLRGLAHPDEAVFYTSGRTSNEAAFLLQLFGRLLGTNNFPDCSNLCHESSGFALAQSIGIGKGTVTLDDFGRADAIFVIGQNPGTNHPRMLSVLQAASRRGAKIVAINPLKEKGLEEFIHPQEVGSMLRGRRTKMSELYLQPLVGGDLALITGIMKCVLEEDERSGGRVLDRSFIAEHTSGFDEFRAAIDATDWATIESQSGLERKEIDAAARVYIDAERVICCWAMGLTQHTHAVQTIQAIVNWLLLRGNIGRPGAGVCPVRGHSNVQGDRTVGITSTPKAPFLDALAKEFDFDPPRNPGLDTVAAIEAMAAGRIRVFFAMGGNFVAASPDTRHTEAALRRVDITAHVSTKLNRSHLVHGKRAFILPCLGRTEVDLQPSGPQVVTVEDSMGIVHASGGRNPPASEHLLSEPAIVAGLALATLPDSTVEWEDLVSDYSRIRESIARVLPAFRDYEERIREPGGFALRNTAREREWRTETGRARFIAGPIPELSFAPGELRLMTIRSHDQFNTTVYGLDDRYRGIHGTREVIFLHPEDIRERELANGDRVRISSRWPGDSRERAVNGFRVVPYDIPRGCAAAYFPETNVLVAADRIATGSRTPVSKLVPVVVERESE